MRKKIVRGLIACCLLLILSASALAVDGSITLMTLNDIHSHIYPYTISKEVKGEKVKVEVGGLARASTLIGKEKAQNPGNVFALEMGDINEGPLFFFYKGLAEIRGLNLAGIDIATLGNHEFDLGPSVLEDLMRYARFPFTVANLHTDLPAFQNLYHPYVIKDAANGLKIGFFGLIAPELFSVTKGSRGFRVGQDLKEEAQHMVKILHEEQCDIIVAMTHVGIYADRAIAQAVEGIHIITGGHSHTLLETPEIITGPNGWKTMVSHGGSMGRYIGIATVAVKNGKLDEGNSSWKARELTSDIPMDKRVAWLINPFQEKLDEKLGEPIGIMTQDADATKAAVRGKEAPLGNFIADSLRWNGQTQIGLMNGGSIRGDKVYPAGEISYKTLYEMLPYGNTLVRIDLTGEQIRDILEVSASALIREGDGYDGNLRTPTGGFLQVSGLKVSYDLKKKPALINNDGDLLENGDRVVEVMVENDDGTWAPLNPGTVYSVTTTDWLAPGGDKYYVFKMAAPTAYSMQVGDVESLAQYIRHLGEIKLQSEERITILQ
jgi:5'-nucleotidase/UDP-sugar diphosphatase